MTNKMKTVYRTLVMALLMCFAATTAVQAQGRIEDMIRELESKNVMTNKVVKRDPTTKRIGMETKNFHFYSQGGVVAQSLREAFEADSRSASDVSREQRGNNYECVLTFVSGRTKTVYRLSITGDKQRPEVDVQTYFRDESINIDESSVETLNTRSRDMASNSILAVCIPAS